MIELRVPKVAALTQEHVDKLFNKLIESLKKSGFRILVMESDMEDQGLNLLISFEYSKPNLFQALTLNLTELLCDLGLPIRISVEADRCAQLEVYPARSFILLPNLDRRILRIKLEGEFWRFPASLLMTYAPCLPLFTTLRIIGSHKRRPKHYKYVVIVMTLTTWAISFITPIIFMDYPTIVLVSLGVEWPIFSLILLVTSMIAYATVALLCLAPMDDNTSLNAVIAGWMALLSAMAPLIACLSILSIAPRWILELMIGIHIMPFLVLTFYYLLSRALLTFIAEILGRERELLKFKDLAELMEMHRISKIVVMRCPPSVMSALMVKLLSRRIVIVSEVLEKFFSPEELRGVIAHEIAHDELKHNDKLFILWLLLLSTIYQTAWTLSDYLIMDQLSLDLIAIIALMPIGLLVTLKVKRFFELEADVRAIELIGDARPYILALAKTYLLGFPSALYRLRQLTELYGLDLEEILSHAADDLEERLTSWDTS